MELWKVFASEERIEQLADRMTEAIEGETETLAQTSSADARRYLTLINRWIEEKLSQLVEAEIEVKTPREVVSTVNTPSMVYQLEKVCCGKSSCKKCGGTAYAHGPYWYGYWKEGGKTRSKYIGKSLDLGKAGPQRQAGQDHSPG